MTLWLSSRVLALGSSQAFSLFEPNAVTLPILLQYSRVSISPLRSPLLLLAQWLFAVSDCVVCSMGLHYSASVFAAHRFAPQLSRQPCSDQASLSRLAAFRATAPDPLPAFQLGNVGTALHMSITKIVMSYLLNQEFGVVCDQKISTLYEGCMPQSVLTSTWALHNYQCTCCHDAHAALGNTWSGLMAQQEKLHKAT